MISVVQQIPFLYRIELVAKKHTTILIIHASIHIFETTPFDEQITEQEKKWRYNSDDQFADKKV